MSVHVAVHQINVKFRLLCPLLIELMLSDLKSFLDTLLPLKDAEPIPLAVHGCDLRLDSPETGTYLKATFGDFMNHPFAGANCPVNILLLASHMVISLQSKVVDTL